jgi:hypothetical protein
MTDEQVEQEIERLRSSEFVKLAKKEEQIRYRRRQYMCTLRTYERKGKELFASGITLDALNSMLDEESDGDEC